MATKKKAKRTRTRYARAKSHRRRDQPIHAVPDLMEVIGIVFPLTQGAGNGDQLAWDHSAGIGQNISYNMGVVMNEYTNPANLVPAAELVIGGLVVKWIGKKTGLNRVGTKKVKVL